MFAAYSSALAKEADAGQEDQKPSDKSDWLANTSFKTAIKSEPQVPIQQEASDSSSSEDLETKASSKRHKKKKKKKNVKKRRDSSLDVETRKKIPRTTPVDTRTDLEKLLDNEYFKFFAAFSKDQVKKFQFYDDVPGLTPRNAFKVDRYGDKNNLCFDSAYHKLVPSYRVPYDHAEHHVRRLQGQSSGGKKLTRKQLRKQMLRDLNENRYFVKIAKIPALVDKQYGSNDLAQNTLSNKAWLYLQMKNELADDQEPQVDRSSDYVKYLSENSRDVAKWLEFIDYTSTATRTKSDDQSSKMTANSMGLYQRKIGIFERALKENPNSFRLQIEFMKFKASASELSSQIDSIESVESDFLKLLIGQSFSLAPNARDLDQEEYCKSLFEIWFEYLRFLLFNASSAVSYDRIRRTFIKCFEFFLQSKNKAINRQASKHFFHCRLLKLFDLFCSFQARCGFTEKAIGAYQAIIDFNLCKNASQGTATGAGAASKYDNLDFSSRKVLLELYWDIGLPKFGEHLSTGWLNCLENRDSCFQKLELDYPDNRPMGRDYGGLFEHEQKVVDDKSVRIEYRWLDVERLRSCLNWYPFYPQSYVGESSDDCADPDRLISFDEDISFTVFDLSNLKSRGGESGQRANEQTDSLKFKLICSYLKFLRVLSWDDECLDIKLSKLDSNRVENEELLRTCCHEAEEDLDFAHYLDERLIGPTGNSFGGHVEEALVRWSRAESKNEAEIANYYHELVKKTVAYVRNVLDQSARGLETLKYQTHLTLLRWRFEVKMAFLFRKYEKLLSNVNRELTWSSTVDSLLARAKSDLSREENRSNFHLWKEYGILKWLLAQATSSTKPVGLNKETKKVFDTLLATSQSAFRATTKACIDIFSLCATYAELELGIYYRQFDVSSSSLSHEVDVGLSTINYQKGFFDLTSEMTKAQADSVARRLALTELIAKHCLSKNEEQAKAKTKATFSIGISSSTKLLITKRDFQREYEAQVKQMKDTVRNPVDPDLYEQAEKKLYLFHKVYSLVLLCLNDIDALLQLNDSMLKEPISGAHHSGLLEFYLSILNHLHFQEARLGKLAFKTKLFAIVRSTILRTGTGGASADSFCGRSFLRYLATTLIRFKLDNTKLFCSQLIESNDIDLIMTQICLATASSMSSIFQASCSSFWMSLIATERYKLHKNMCTQQETRPTTASSPLPIHGGVQHQIRRQFQQAVKSRPRSALLWSHFWQFECQLSASAQVNNKLLFVYYQAIRNVPYVQSFYVNAIEHLPDKYIEVMSVLSNREIRSRLPIEELNLLLEPVSSKQDEDLNQKDSESESEGYMVPNELASEASESRSEDSEVEQVDDQEGYDSSPAKMDDLDS